MRMSNYMSVRALVSTAMATRRPSAGMDHPTVVPEQREAMGVDHLTVVPENFESSDDDA